MKNYSENDIIRYLNGEMDAREKEAFDQRMSENASLRKEVEEFRLVTEALQDSLLHEVRHEVSGFEPSGSVWPWFRIAAAVVILFSTGLFLYQWNFSGYDSYFDPYPNIVQSRGVSYGAIEESMKAYSEGDYETAIAGLSRLEKTDTISFYLGNAHLFHQEPKLAEEYLTRVADSSSLFSQQAEWLLVRALLDQNRKSEAIRLLQQILQEENHSYFRKAGLLLEELN